MPAMIVRDATPAATASSMISAMNTEQCCPRETPASAASACWPSSATLRTPPIFRPCSSMKDPVPVAAADHPAGVRYVRAGADVLGDGLDTFAMHLARGAGSL